ncbi:MAG: PilZ domain-containing protein, partial [Endomicrobia bacterium]|nr:PilZ domain-containing protein [Endomicrobiia bacterium]
LRTETISGKVVWAKTKGDMYNIGIRIINMDSIDAKHINRMAIDYNDCENKIILGVPDVCSLKCSYYYICEKPQKIMP